MSLVPAIPTPKTKRYFITNKQYNLYPDAFVQSQNPKYVYVLGCKLFGTVGSRVEGTGDDKKTIKTVQNFDYVELHANFIQDFSHLNGYVCFCNETLPKRKKYQLLNSGRDFRVWFQNYDGTPFDLNKDERQAYFVLELMLEY
jgi:hypothetical protein